MPDTMQIWLLISYEFVTGLSVAASAFIFFFHPSLVHIIDFNILSCVLCH